MNGFHPCVASRDPVQNGTGPVGGTIVHDDDFEGGDSRAQKRAKACFYTAGLFRAATIIETEGLWSDRFDVDQEAKPAMPEHEVQKHRRQSEP